MAFYVVILKQSEDHSAVIYSFGSTEEKLGLLQLEKDSGNVKELEPVPEKNSESLFARAAVKVRQHWKEGLYPEKTCWAS